jgi:hypothetical protein
MPDECRMKFAVTLCALLTFSALAANVVSKYEQPEFRTATIYARGSNQKTALFKLTRTTSWAEKQLKVSREFSYPDGKLAARERFTYNGDKLVSGELADMQMFGKGSANVIEENGDTKIVFDYVEGTKHKTGSETFDQNTVNADMINPFLVAHWDRLMSGDVVKCRYIVFSRCETVGFEFTKQRETTVNGIPMVIVKMAPSSLFIAALVDPLIFTIEKNGKHRVLEYDGPTTPKIKQGEKFKDLDAATVFGW